MEINNPKLVYYEDEDFVLKVEPHEGYLYLHCDVQNWTGASLKKGYSTFKSLLQEAGEKGYNGLRTITPNPNFAKLFGGETLGYINRDNKQYEVIEWELKR